MSTVIPTWDEIYKQQQDSLAADKQKKKDETTAIYDSKAQVTQQQYDAAVKDAESGFASDYQKNAVQKIINEQQIAENMANMGITNSGLNRTQQTAAQLSYANENANIDNSRRKTLSDLSLSLATSLAAIEQDKITDLGKIDTYYDDEAKEQADTIYNSYVDMYNASQKSLIDANTRLQADTKPKNVINTKNSTLGKMQGSFASNNISYIRHSDGSTTYADKLTGISVKLDKGVNPFTGNNNLIENTATAKAAEKYGTFSNGYQPKGVIGYGTLKAKDTKSDFTVNRRHVTIWESFDESGKSTGNYWAWDGANNEYFEVVFKNDEWHDKSKVFLEE